MALILSLMFGLVICHLSSVEDMVLYQNRSESDSVICRSYMTQNKPMVIPLFKAQSRSLVMQVVMQVKKRILWHLLLWISHFVHTSAYTLC